MDIEISALTNEELMALNHRIVDLLKRRQERQAGKALEKFALGDLVFFDSEDGSRIKGVVTKINRKTISVQTKDQGRWRVSPMFVHKAKENMNTDLLRIH